MLCLSLFQQKLQINPIEDLSLDILIRQIDGCCYWLCLWWHQLAFRAQFRDAKRSIAFDKLARPDKKDKFIVSDSTIYYSKLINTLISYAHHSLHVCSDHSLHI